MIDRGLFLQVGILTSDGGNLIIGTLPANDPVQNQTTIWNIQNQMKKDQKSSKLQINADLH